MRTVLTADLGGTKCRFALVDEKYGVHAVQRIDTVRDREQFLSRMKGAVEKVLDASRAHPKLEPPIAFGVGAAGVVDPAGRSLGDPPNLPLGGFPLTDWFQEQGNLGSTRNKHAAAPTCQRSTGHGGQPPEKFPNSCFAIFGHILTPFLDHGQGLGTVGT